ncbi:MAG: histidine--tRNA ligase [Thermoplasmata archaeon]|nr:histidine--tRNA ligase [Thermoplasmata archaeon]
MPFSTLRGFRDYAPPDAAARSELWRRIRQVGHRCGFQELETPSVESLDLFRVKSGGEIEDQVWAFDDKGGREVALIPETTPGLARVFAERAKSEPLPVKWMTFSKLWRYEEPQAGRTREFSQVNFDILGVPGVEADAEVLAAAALALDEVGAQGLHAFRVNDRRLAEAVGRSVGARDLVLFFHALDRRSKVTEREFEAELQRSGVGGDGVARLSEILAAAGAGVPAADVSTFLGRWEAPPLPAPGPEGLSRLRDLFARILKLGLGDRVVFDPTVVRGLAYYTSTVFECYAREGDLRSLFGGGRYDHLVELFGGPPTPACGLAIGDQTLELLLRGAGRWPEGDPPLDTYVIAATPEFASEAAGWVQRLRAAGLAADADIMGRSMSRQLREAARRRARRALIVGPQEAARGVVLERDLTSGAQRELRPDEVLPPA